MATSPCFLSNVSPKQLEEYLDKNPDLPGSYYKFFKENYLDKGLIDETAVHVAARDLNIPPGHLRRILDRPKSVRPYRAAVADAARKRRAFLRDNEDYVNRISSPYIARFFRSLYDLPRETLLWGHGATPTGTHMWPYLTRVDKWGRWLGGVKREMAAWSSKYHDQLRGDIEAHPWYKFARDVGKVDVEFKETPTGWRAFVGGGGWNKRAFNAALIPARLYEFQSKMQFWTGGRAEAIVTEGGVKPREQIKSEDLFSIKELAEEIGKEVNHSTGTLSPGESWGITPGMALSPKLMQSSWYKAVFDPARTIYTYERMAESLINPNIYVSAAERRANHMRAVNTAAWLVSTAASLALNQALLKATGQKQDINWRNFDKTDLWRYKWGGWILRPRGGIENLALIARLFHMFGEGRKAGRTWQERQQELVGQYAEYKAHPIFSTASELASGETLYGDRVPALMERLPWLRDKPHTKGQQQLTWPEYLSEHGPIFIGGAVHEYYAAMREQGMDVNHLNTLFRGLSNPEAVKRAGIAMFGEFFGFGIYKERPQSGPKKRGKGPAYYSE